MHYRCCYRRVERTSARGEHRAPVPESDSSAGDNGVRVTVIEPESRRTSVQDRRCVRKQADVRNDRVGAREVWQRRSVALYLYREKAT